MKCGRNVTLSFFGALDRCQGCSFPTLCSLPAPGDAGEATESVGVGVVADFKKGNFGIARDHSTTDPLDVVSE